MSEKEANRAGMSALVSHAAPNAINRMQRGFPNMNVIRDPRVMAAVTWIEHHFAAKDIDMGEIAQAVNLSSSRLRHLFQQEMGVTLRRYHKLRRLQKARDLLSRSFLSIKQVMAEVGWIDASHFCRDYKLVYGESPSKVRSMKLKSETNAATCGLR